MCLSSLTGNRRAADRWRKQTEDLCMLMKELFVNFAKLALALTTVYVTV